MHRKTWTVVILLAGWFAMEGCTANRKTGAPPTPSTDPGGSGSEVALLPADGGDDGGGDGSTGTPPPPPSAPLSSLPFLAPPEGAVRCTSSVPAPSYLDSHGCFQIGNREVWTINRPSVNRAETAYPAIRFRAGDRVSILGGGCAERGGVNPSWRRYVEPETITGALDDLYFGSVLIPGVIPVATPLHQQMRRPPVDVFTDPGTNGYLRLRYADNGYSDNGYTSSDALDRRGTLDQCYDLDDAWVIVAIQHNCAGSTAPSCSTASPLDVLPAGSDLNGLPANARWGLQDLLGSRPNVAQLCSISRRTLQTFPHDDVSLCTRQTTAFNNNPGLCPVTGAGDPPTRGGIGGHVNWISATYNGTLFFSDRSRQSNPPGLPSDEDDTWRLLVNRIPNLPPSLGSSAQDPTVNGIPALDLEFHSSEVTRQARSSWWSDLNQRISTNQDAVDDYIKGEQAVVLGMFNIDCGHECHSELHPVYVMAIRLNSRVRIDGVDPVDPNNDAWAIFARNWGGEGYCSPLQIPASFAPNYVGSEDRVNVPLRTGFGNQGGVLSTVRVLLPPPPTGQWSSAQLLPSCIPGQTDGCTEVRYSHPTNTSYQVTSGPQGATVTFNLRPDTEESLIDGVIRLRWIPAG